MVRDWGISLSKAKLTAILIPTRMESTRFPGKPLTIIKGQSLLWHTYQQARATGVGGVYVVTSDVEIETHCNRFEIPYLSVQGDFPCGTARCIAATREWRKSASNPYRYFVNWQVDEPLVEASDIIRLIDDTEEGIGTLCGRLEPRLSHDEDVVKILALPNGRCQWFTRRPVVPLVHHVGVYCFPLYIFNSLAPRYREKHYVSELAESESLEQMAWIEWNIHIQATSIDGPVQPSVNRPSDVTEIERILCRKN